MGNPRRLYMAVRLSIYGFHFRKMLKSVHQQIEKLASASANQRAVADNECGLAADKSI